MVRWNLNVQRPWWGEKETLAVELESEVSRSGRNRSWVEWVLLQLPVRLSLGRVVACLLFRC